MLRKLVTTAVIATLLASPVIAAAEAPAPAEVAPAQEEVSGLQFWDTTSPILIFLALMGVGIGLALLINPDDEPASP